MVAAHIDTAAMVGAAMVGAGFDEYNLYLLDDDGDDSLRQGHVLLDANTEHMHTKKGDAAAEDVVVAGAP